MRKLTCVGPISLWSAGLFMAGDGETVPTKREKGGPLGREYKLQTAGGRGKQQIHERELRLRPPQRRGFVRRELYNRIVSARKRFLAAFARRTRVRTARNCDNNKMARGWESKSAEAQQAEAGEKPSTPRPRLSPEEAANQRQREVR